MKSSFNERSQHRPGLRATATAAGALAATLALVACGPQAGGSAVNGTTAPVVATQSTYAAQPTAVQPGAAPGGMTQWQPVPLANNAPATPGVAPNGYPNTMAYAPPPGPPPQTYAQAPAYTQAQAPAYAQPQDEVRAPAQVAAPARVAAPVASAHLGEIRAIEPIRTRPQGNGTGAVIGGVLGAVVGNQFGHGNGRAVTTVLGGVGGAVAGNNVERNHREDISGYRVSVRLDNGTSRTFTESNASEYRVGDRVRIDRGQLRPV